MLSFLVRKPSFFRLTLAAILLQWASAAMASRLNADLPDVSFAVRAGTIPPNQDCDSDSDCASGMCTASYNGPCDRLNAAGQVVDCSTYDYYGHTYCQGYPLNHTCANQGECRNGHCNKKGICVKTQVGQACYDDLGCSNPQVCRNGTCFQPAAHSLYPAESCKVDASCRSGSCVTTVPTYKILDGPYQVQTRPECDYFSQGQQGCRSLYDCKDALCKNGTCQLGVNGDRCLANFMCQNLCSLDGVCYTPDPLKPLAHDQPCKNNTQCLSGVCYQLEGTITRPDFTKPGQNFTYPYEGYCSASQFGGKCRKPTDCAQGNCAKGICTGAALNATCAQDKDCASLTCIKSSSKKSGSCAISQASTDGLFIGCTSNSDCFSNQCIASGCPAYQKECPAKVCNSIPTLGQCRVPGDCDVPYSGNTCKRGKCVYGGPPGR